MFSSIARNLKTVGAKMSTAGIVAPESFSGGVQLFHWVSGGAMMGCVATVLTCQQIKDKKWKGKLM